MRRRNFIALALAAFAVGAGLAAVVAPAGEPPQAKAAPTHASTPGVRKPAPKRVPPPRLTLAAVGDITLGRTPILPTGGAASLLYGASRSLRANVVLGNLETTLTDDGPLRCAAGTAGCFTFRAPPAYAGGLSRTGFTVLNLANNHSLDFGAAGQARTIAALRHAGVHHTGRPGEIAVVVIGRTRVAVLGFAPYPWSQSLLDVEAAQRLVRKAARRADIVVVTMHAGAEGSDRTHVRTGPETYLGERRGDPVAFAHAVVNAGADLVVGHGPHVLRGIEWYHGRLIAYSLGNFSSYRTLSVDGVLGVSVVLRVTLTRDGRWVRGRLVPIRLVGEGAPVLDRGRRAWTLVRGLSRQDFGARGVRITPHGELVPPTRRR